MAKLPKGIYVRATEDGFIEIQVVKYSNDIDVGRTLRIEGKNAPHVIERVRQVYREESPPRSEHQIGDDSLSLIIGGHERAPVLNLQNARPDGAIRSGCSSAPIPWNELDSVLDQMTALVAGAR